MTAHLTAKHDKNVTKYICKPYNQAEECPISGFMEQFSGKWKPVVIWMLHRNGKMRFGELNVSIAGISEKVLSSQLKELQKIGIIERIVIAETPPKVEYELTNKGTSVIPVLASIVEWCFENEPIG